jgi:biopolymer transport protein ExbB
MVRSRLALLAAVLALLPAPPCLAQEPQTPASSPTSEPSPAETKTETKAETKPETAPSAKPKAAAAVGRESILALFTTANPILWLLGLCSVVAVGYTLERLIALRRGRVIPRDFTSRFLERLSGGKLDRERALELCRSNDSPMARVFGHVVRYWGQSSLVIRQGLDQDGAREVLDLRRNVRVLNGTATLAPLLGLLGTVMGMIQSFDAIGGRVGGAKGEALAKGISLALVSTAIGLGIAVASVTMYYYLLNRIDALVRDLDDNARAAIDLVSLETLRGNSRATGGELASRTVFSHHGDR